ncbi:MAG: RsmB/NOP family class I SAM-dependent RNA methyltransferase [Rhodobacteraceae bacterium]|nr:RsmB/NOP family class I SAM-dependent RNA methyltransferase [Paracoccaceae bacterium]
MTPAARVSAAIEVLDQILAGLPAERALAAWGRGNRYAGSKDRAALRDLVFDALRRKRSYAALGGAETGRGLMIGALRHKAAPVEDVFSGARFAPAPLSAEEARAGGAAQDPAAALDCPDWLFPLICDALGDLAEPVLDSLRDRAPVALRVHLGRTTRDAAQAALLADGIETATHPLSPSALHVTGGARRIRASAAFATGDVELQDAASQAVADMVPLPEGGRMLDYCAGGGGKTLAVGARVRGQFWAHDVDLGRMVDLPVRASRAGLAVTCIDTAALAGAAPFDVVLVDAPCSGSGSWRRDPQGKWALTPDRLAALRDTQAAILDQAAQLVAEGGHLVYMTCSLLDQENSAQISDFLRRMPAWRQVQARALTPLDGGDGFFFSALTRSSPLNNL